jgi:hypothetical protein
MKSEGSLPCSQEPTTGPCAESTEFRRQSPKQSLFRPILILFFNLLLGLPRVIFPSGVLTESFYAFILSLTRATCHAIRLHHVLNPDHSQSSQPSKPQTSVKATKFVFLLSYKYAVMSKVGVESY